jgi:hypothetical protein
MRFQLKIVEGQEAGKALAFEQGSVLIGRVAGCDVVLHDPGISRRHCRISAEGGGYFVEDLGSSNGTRLNETGVSGRQPLGEGDRISLGPVVLVFTPGEAPAAAAGLERFWLESSPKERGALVGLGVVAAIGLLSAVAWGVLGGEEQVARGPEPVTLGPRPIEASFGLGEGVTWERPDQKVFEWEYTAATRVLGLLHFQARDISEGEVLVTVNGVDVGQVPADTLASQERVLEVRVPSGLLKRGETNRIVFDHTKNPPGEDSWRIWNLRLEKVLLPELPPEQLVEEAKKAYARGRGNLDMAAVGARNRYEAWKSFREAWLLLEAHPEPRPDLYFESRERVKEAQLELDRVCARLLREVEGYAHQKNWEAASGTLHHLREYFPDDEDQPCARRAELKRASYGL